MKNKSVNRRIGRSRASLMVTLALLVGVPACGDLDEKDTEQPSAFALTRWDSSHLLALTLYYKHAFIVDLQSGVPTGRVELGDYYHDIEAVGNGAFMGLRAQSLDYFDSDRRIDASRSIQGALWYSSLAVSADYSTVAYSSPTSHEATKDAIGVASLRDGITRVSPPGEHDPFGPSPYWPGMALSRDGNLLAYLGRSFDVAVGVTYAPTAPGLPAVSACVNEWPARADSIGGPATVDFSPVEDKLVVGFANGWVSIFDLSHYPDCPRLLSFPLGNGDPNFEARISHIRHSPNGALLAVASERRVDQDFYGYWIDLIDASSGALLRSWMLTQQKYGTQSGVMVTDLQWSDASDRISVALQSSIQHWDVTTAALLWERNL
jgi:hypothetical protein